MITDLMRLGLIDMSARHAGLEEKRSFVVFLAGVQTGDLNNSIKGVLSFCPFGNCGV